MDQHDQYMLRCIDLARRGMGATAPNPMVGAVLVCNGRIIGEGYHERFGGPHAEVNCVNAVSEADRELIPKSAMYVSLEPCAHFGKTPPCADLIIRENIPVIVIGTEDPFREVNGRGITRLREAGRDVLVMDGKMAEKCRELNKRFFTHQLLHRPYIILKWAETADGKIGIPGRRLLISDEVTNRLVHRWRSEEAAILIGAGTAAADDPLLDNRLWHGISPHRFVIDPALTLSTRLRLFTDGRPVNVINHKEDSDKGLIRYRKVDPADGVKGIMKELAGLGIASVLVEGGQKTLQAFLDAGYFDELRIIRSSTVVAAAGISAPTVHSALPVTNIVHSGPDTINYYKNDVVGN